VGAGKVGQRWLVRMPSPQEHPPNQKLIEIQDWFSILQSCFRHPNASPNLLSQHSSPAAKMENDRGEIVDL
jgi:hypothetical protein